MNMYCLAGLPSVLDKAFSQQNWRQQPVAFRGGVGAFFGRPSARADVVAATRNMAATAGSRTIWFLERATSGVPGIGELCRDATEFFEWRDVCCDVFYMKGASSIGGHLNNSDNFSRTVWHSASPRPWSSRLDNSSPGPPRSQLAQARLSGGLGRSRPPSRCPYGTCQLPQSHEKL